MIELKYGNTNTYLIKGKFANLLVDTDYAGTLNSFFKEIKNKNLKINDINYMIVTHYHPDHMGIVRELQDYGIKLIIIDKQLNYVNFSDDIFKKEKRLGYKSIDIQSALIVSLPDSRSFLSKLGINGKIVSTPSHSADSISLILDDGRCFVGDLEPIDYLLGYENNNLLIKDWEVIMSYSPKVICYGHVNKKVY